MVQTIYPASFADEVAIVDMNMRPGPSLFPRPDCAPLYHHCTIGTNPGRTHRLYTGTPVVKFGQAVLTRRGRTALHHHHAPCPSHRSGLLAAHQDGNSMLRAAHVAAAGVAMNHTITVTNTSGLDADDAVLTFLVPPGAGVHGAPLPTLYGFERVHFRAGQSVTVNIPAQHTDFSTVGRDGVRTELSGTWTVRIGVQAPGMGYAEHTINAL